MHPRSLVVSVLAVALAGLAGMPISAEQGHGNATELRGMVRRSAITEGRTALSVATETGSVTANVSEPLPGDGSGLIGAMVRIKGHWVPITSNRGMVVGRQFVVPAATSIEVIEAATPLQDLPVRRIGDILRSGSVGALEPRVKVRGIVTREISGSLYVSDSTDSIFVGTRQPPTTKPGDVVDVIGFPGVEDRRPELSDATYQIVASMRPPDPTPVTAQQLMRGVHQAALVRVEGVLTGQEASAGRYRLMLSADGIAFEARVGVEMLGAVANRYATGSRLALVGVCSVQFDNAGRVRSFRIYPRTAADFVVVQSAHRWTESRVLMLLGASGAVLAFSAVWIVVLRRRIPETERALQRSEARYREIFERSPAGNFITRADGVIVDCNDRFARILGFPGRDEALAINANQLYRDPADRANFLEMLSNDGRVEQYETTLVRADGSSLQVLESSIGRFDAAGNLVEVEGYVIDVTKQKLAEAALHESEAQLRQAQRMEGMGRLAGGIAHDFNNLLTAILGFSELLLQDSDLSGQPRADIEQIRRSANSAASLTRQLLAFSRKQVLNPATLDLNQVVADVAAMLRRVLGEDISLTTTEAREQAYVLADRGQVEQVLMNLAVNARDAMPGGGRLDIAVKVGISNVFLQVRDTGCGIPAAILPNIFEPFFTTKSVGEGTGLGLATVYGIVTQTGGSIDVDSAEGRGTTFSISLPRFTAAPQMADADVEPGELRGHETVLVVEDEPAVRSLVLASLERYGYRVVVAEDAAGALAAIPRIPEIALVLSDVVMPRMNGSELITRIRALKPSVRVALMSGYTAYPGGQTPKIPTGVPFLQKPFTPRRLAAVVRAALDAVDPMATRPLTESAA